MKQRRLNSLEEKASYIRKEVVSISVTNRAGHIAPSLSCVDILVALYHGAMKYKPDNPNWDGRDRLVFSKAHGCYALYAILADRKILPKKEWHSFYTEESTLLGCMERRLEYGLEAGCGSLGHGLPIAVGIAYGAKLQGKKYNTFCVVGDGELQEGTTWEALQFAVKHEISNLIIIIDSNRLQAMDFIVNVLDREIKDKVKKLKGFGLTPKVVHGHKPGQILKFINKAKLSSGKVPKVIIAETIKGFGLKCMENVPRFHFRIPTEQEIAMGESYASLKSNIKNKKSK
ncbi:MAG: transketolase [Candidatus Omnitrophica bacterium]|jgi:transketolase|nr:transketolase [Candidatus Omnitrophota bacterium]